MNNTLVTNIYTGIAYGVNGCGKSSLTGSIKAARPAWLVELMQAME